MNDDSLFINSSERSFTTLLVFVDDIILARNDKEEIAWIKQALNQTFKIKDLWDLRYFLSLEVARSKKGIMVNQRKYALKLLTDASLLACKPALTPIDNHKKFSSTGSVPFIDIQVYKRLIGRIMYLTNTQPDITFLCNNFLSFLLSLQLLIILQRLEFSNILKELQVLVYFSLPTLLLISKPFVIVIGAPAVIQDNQWLVLVYILGILSYLGNQRSKEQYHRVFVKLNTGQWPLLHVKFNV